MAQVVHDPSVLVSVLKNSELAAIPTETVYGLAGLLTDETLLKIFKAKERPLFDPLIVHIPKAWASLEALKKHELIDSAGISESLLKKYATLIQANWPGPLTLLFPKGKAISDLVTSGLKRVAIRCPNQPESLKLLELLNAPLAAPSANRFGGISPTTTDAVQKELGDRIDWILEGGPCEIGIESTVLGFDLDEKPVVLRPGGISLEALQSTLSEPVHYLKQTQSALEAPGQLPSHYAPKKPLYLLPTSIGAVQKTQISALLKKSKCGLLLYQNPPAKKQNELPDCVMRILSPNGHPEEAAQNFFRYLRELDALDASDAEILLAEPCPTSSGLGLALQDRLQRASRPL